ncbi:sugar transporter [Roseibaca sp. Y0-43]|uniref:sugar transporter n=1 Tax=Roseibaca sp. Y0-43 TaxID=2816854 RepID=UPI001D0C1515|nr:sugar transporter [Roseibaca sp. Y0-43]
MTIYLTFFAKDQYASTVGFTVRQAETSGASELMGGLTSILGAGAQNHSDLLFEFVQSQEMVQLVSEDFDLIGHYSQNWPYDPIYSIWPSATIEDQTWFWNRMVRVTYDKASGMMVLQVRAHDPEIARELATLIIRQSEEMINRLNSEARADATRNAEADLETALERLRAAREALVKLRVQTQIVDPEADIEAQMGVLMNFQQQLAEALVEYDILSQTSELTDPRLRQLELRIEVIRERIRDERLNGVERNVTTDGTDYPNLIAQFERLEVDQAFAEIAYQAALTALDVARSNAARQSLFLANFIRPTLAQRAEYPQTIQVIGLTFFFGLMFWAVLALVYYSLRDRG